MIGGDVRCVTCGYSWNDWAVKECPKCILAAPEPDAPASSENAENVTLIPVAQEIKPDGLQLIFSEGEMLPFKSIWFEVENVAKDYLVLRPRTTTSAFQKAKARGQKA